MNDLEILDLFLRAGKLKRIKRTGWVRKDVPDPESVSDHCFRCAFMAVILGDILDLDSEKLMKMALIHDLGESEIGDITPYDDISDEVKTTRENEAMAHIFEVFSEGGSYLSLWNEYKEQKTKEAQAVKNIDDLEMALSAFEYQREYPGLDLSEFFQETDPMENTPKIQSLFHKIKMQVKATPQ